MDQHSAPVITGLLFCLTLAIVALMAWRGGSEKRDVALLASSAGVSGLLAGIAAVAL